MQLLHFHLKNRDPALKGTGTERDVCLGFLASTTAKFPVAPAQSSPMDEFMNCFNYDAEQEISEQQLQLFSAGPISHVNTYISHHRTPQQQKPDTMTIMKAK